ncbi:cytoplasmic protein [Candidatus Enterococcus clewellii]|uniref:Cytoplasmic protein n=1 Tax=Candidatus Enterococcus clewellii TaxID=1834193 RepID=A0A242KCG2_9ENTE|nr:cytoplasmic protein [Enterococcus sp. 9E7_DIV0242]OTP18759.1 hypothetical protein A5888_000573 [Enterococcus sp. 9E7_DIV0242]
MLPDYIAAHKSTSNHKNTLEKDSTCGCFHCLKIVHPREITQWISDKTGPALCPFCGIDAVLGESSGYPITQNLLQQMEKYWFH